MQTSAATAYRVRTRTRRAPRAAPRATCGARDPLGRYIGTDGRPRELVAIDGQAGSVLVIDRDAITLADRRLVAHIAADEPASNASLICRLYLADETGRRCRPVVPDDLERIAGEEHDPDGALPQEPPARDPTDLLGRVYRVAPCALRGERPEMRWVRRQGGSTEVLSLREVVGSIQSYEPARALTLEAIGAFASDRAVAVGKLRAELVRLEASPIVLNRGLREAVLRALRAEGVSMSEIARRCGRVKRDSRGNESGEASWLGRRIGLLPETGAGRPTPWVHSDVLGLIARRGLGLSPHEVEL